MERQIEVNHYKWRPFGVIHLQQWKSGFLCETCRAGLEAINVEVVAFGAEMDLASITCERCGYVMNIGDDSRWETPIDWDHGAEFRETRQRQRNRLAERKRPARIEAPDETEYELQEQTTDVQKQTVQSAGRRGHG